MTGRNIFLRAKSDSFLVNHFLVNQKRPQRKICDFSAISKSHANSQISRLRGQHWTKLCV